MGITGVSEVLERVHTDPLGLEGEHAHAWTVTAWWRSEPLRDGRALKAALRLLLDALPAVLPAELWSGESLAAHVAGLLENMGCIGARVTRPEGFEVWVWL